MLETFNSSKTTGRQRGRDFVQYKEVRVRETTSFWQENAIGVVILLRILARMSLRASN